MLRSIFTWYLLIQAFTLVGLPLTFAWFRHLPSRGYAAAKTLGILFTGILFWWGGILHLWTNSSAAGLAAACGVAAAGLWMMRSHWADLALWWHDHRRFVIATELIFLVAYILWGMVRASQPQLQTAGGEKWMEIAFLNAVVRSPSMPPHDPWLSGYAISYYYLGYVLLGMLTRLSAMPAAITFNLGNATWFALVATGAYGIVYDLLGERNTARPLLGPVMLLLAGNGEGILEVLHARGWLPVWFWSWLGIKHLNAAPEPPFSWIPTRFFWWWQASRTIQDTTPWGDPQELIDEFPAFSFILGDMHPHVLALPFVLLAVTLALNIYYDQHPQEEKPRQSLARRFSPLVGWALVLGALGALNTWDFPIYWAVIVGALVLGKQRYLGAQQGLLDTLVSVIPDSIVLGVLSITLYFPFWLALRSQAGGILPNLFNATWLHQFGVMFMPLLIPAVGVVANTAARHRIRWRQAVLWGIVLMMGILLLGLLVGSAAAYPYLLAIVKGETIQGMSMSPETAIAAFVKRWWPLWPGPWVGILLAIGTATLALAFLQKPKRNSTMPDSDFGTGEGTAGVAEAVGREGSYAGHFPALLILLGSLLTLAPEFVYLRDVFMTRMNTIFKFYFQAWILWSLGGAWQLAQWLKRPARVAWRRRLLVSASGLLIILGMVYTALAVPARAREMGVPWTLDGAAWLKAYAPGDYAAIEWLNTYVEGSPVILEAPGDKRSAYVYEGRISALTGLPTLLGWGGHELQWRGNYDEPALREGDIERLFTTEDIEETRMLLTRYGVEYVIIGHLERERYPAAGLDKFTEVFPIVYQQDGVSIVRVTP